MDAVRCCPLPRWQPLKVDGLKESSYYDLSVGEPGVYAEEMVGLEPRFTQLWHCASCEALLALTSKENGPLEAGRQGESSAV